MGARGVHVYMSCGYRVEGRETKVELNWAQYMFTNSRSAATADVMADAHPRHRAATSQVAMKICTHLRSHFRPQNFNFRLPGVRFGTLGLHFGGLVLTMGTHKGANVKKTSFQNFFTLPCGHPVCYMFA